MKMWPVFRREVGSLLEGQQALKTFGGEEGKKRLKSCQIEIK
jgi:hypothetical protein